MAKKVGIMGGTFDPIHYGHLIAAERAREHKALDEIWFIPTGNPSYKSQPPQISAEIRLELVRLAIQDHADFRVSDIEIRRDGITYSIDTVHTLLHQFPDHEFSYIIGADMVVYLLKWHKIKELSNLIQFIGVQRPGTEISLEILPSFLQNKVHLVDMPLIEISSTDIRRRRMNNQSIRYLVPMQVQKHIEEHGYYGS